MKAQAILCIARAFASRIHEVSNRRWFRSTIRHLVPTGWLQSLGSNEVYHETMHISAIFDHPMLINPVTMVLLSEPLPLLIVTES